MRTLPGMLRRMLELRRQLGTRDMVRYLWRRLMKKAALEPADIVGAYDFVTVAPFGSNPGTHLDPRTITWFVPDFDIGSGGHINIFRLVYNLESLGYTCHIALVGPCRYTDVEATRRLITEHFSPVKASVSIGTEAVPPAFYVVATSWVTAYYARAFRGAAHRVYFVQDFEPAFFPVGSHSVLAENTYRFGFFGITAGGWLATKLATDYGMATHAIGFASEAQRYTPKIRRKPEVPTVFFYVRPPTSRRAFELGILVLNEVAHQVPAAQFVLAGWDVSGYRIPFPHLNAGSVALDDLADLYSQCDIALVLSCTNLSLLPLELMACGVAVVSNRGPNVEWLLNEDIAALADPTVEDLSAAIVELLGDDPRRLAIAARGLEFVRDSDWGHEARRFADGLERLGATDEAVEETPTGKPDRARARLA